MMFYACSQNIWLFLSAVCCYDYHQLHIIKAEHGSTNSTKLTINFGDVQSIDKHQGLEDHVLQCANSIF